MFLKESDKDMASNYLRLLLLCCIAAATMGSDEGSNFCLVGNLSGECPKCSAFRRPVDGTPPMLVAPKGNKGKGAGYPAASGSSASPQASGGGGKARGGRRSPREAAQTAADAIKNWIVDNGNNLENYSCKVNGKNKAWFIAIKKPDSYEYAYLSSKSPRNKENWEYAGNITTEGPVYETLEQARQNRGAVFAYSDKPPPNETWIPGFGHLKGLFMVGNPGFWMMFSARHFPRFDEPSEFSQDPTYAQSFICISVKSETIKDLSGWLEQAKPRYHHPHEFGFPENESRTEISIESFSSKGNVPFNLFVKGKNSPAECIYRKICDSYQAGEFRVQSWLRTISERKRNISGNIKKIRMTVGDDTWEWNTTTDHSKWCVSEQRNIVCLSDLNRMDDQLTQGGAAVCIRNDSVWRAFNALVSEVYTGN